MSTTWFLRLIRSARPRRPSLPDSISWPKLPWMDITTILPSLFWSRPFFILRTRSGRLILPSWSVIPVPADLFIQKISVMSTRAYHFHRIPNSYPPWWHHSSKRTTGITRFSSVFAKAGWRKLWKRVFATIFTPPVIPTMPISGSIRWSILKVEKIMRSVSFIPI